METAVSTPPVTAPRSAEEMKRMTMSPVSAIPVGSGFRTTSWDGMSSTPSNGKVRPIVRSAVRRWKRLHEQVMMEKLVHMRQDKKAKNKEEKDEARRIARRIPVEILAKEWLSENNADVDIRAYLVDKVLPTLILGCEKLLTEVDTKGLAEREEVEPNFNPINFLAKYLMRNNPRYSNFSESSPYVRGLREVTEHLRKELFKIEDNRLARIKADVKRRQEDRARQEELKRQELIRRQEALRKQFVQWTDNSDAQLELILVQSSLRSFEEVVSSFPEDLKSVAKFDQSLDPTDECGNKLNIKEFSQYLLSYIGNMATDIFDLFMDHLSRCATAYRDGNSQEERRILLTNLFSSCDHSGIGLLDRHRVLQLFEQFWDSARETYKSKLRNPRRWPVVEVEEAEDGDSEDDFEEVEGTQELASGTSENRVDATSAPSAETQEVSAIPPTDVSQSTNIPNETEAEVKDSEKISAPEPTQQGEATETGEVTEQVETTVPGEETQQVETTEAGEVTQQVETTEAGEETQQEEKTAIAEGTEQTSQETAETLPQQDASNEGETESTGEKAEPKESEEEASNVTQADAGFSSDPMGTDEVGPKTSSPSINDISMPTDVPPTEAILEGVHVPEAIPEALEERGATDGTVLPNSDAGRGSVSFAGVTLYGREKTGLSLTSVTHSQASAFDECSLNVSQFVQVIETFLNDKPPKEIFDALVRYLREQYVETEDEKLKRLLKARQEAISAKRKWLINTLFEKWDNDGSGYLDLEEIEVVMLKYKDGQEAEAIHRSREKLKEQAQFVDQRLSKREFRTFLEMIVEEMPGPESFENFVEFLTSSVERSYAERIRGEARKKWLQQVVTAGETGGSSMEPVYREVFQALYKDAESHGGGKKISAYIAMLEKNTTEPQRGDVALRYVATTPEDVDILLGKILYRDMHGVSFASVETGKPIHVPRVSNHGNIHFWDTDRIIKEGSFIVVPLKDRRKRVFGLMGIDTLNGPHSKAIFITHEIQFFQGVAKAFSIAYHYIDIRKKLLRITESAISWIYRRSPHMNEITMYLVEPDVKTQSYSLRKMMMTDEKGTPNTFEPPPKLERKDNLFRDYLFKCVDNSETISADAYGARHLAIPLRDEQGKAVAIVDIGIGALKKLPPHENREVQRMLKLLQLAHREITKELAGEEKTRVLEVEKDEDTRVDVMFDRLMLMELRENVSKLDSRSYSELRSYNEPPKVVHDILKAVLSIFYLPQAEEGDFEDWTNVKSYINNELSQKISEYDPTASEVLIPSEKVMDLLKDVPHGAVTKHGSVPAQYMYNWVFVCLSLIEHTRKMRENTNNDVLETGDVQTQDDSDDVKDI